MTTEKIKKFCPIEGCGKICKSRGKGRGRKPYCSDHFDAIKRQEWEKKQEAKNLIK